MEIPLALRAKKDGSLVYEVPLSFRAVMAAIFGVVVAAVFGTGPGPGLAAWIVLAIVAAAGLFEERWTFDRERIVHRSGLLPLARSRTIAVGDVARFRLEPFARGTVIGSADEARRKTAELSGGRQGSPFGRQFWERKTYLHFVCETSEGSRFFIDALPLGRADALRGKAKKIADACGKELVEG